MCMRRRFATRMFDAYKGTRKPMDEELRQQVPMIKEMLTAMGIKIVEKEGYEADDILGTLSVRAEKAGMDVAIISGDRDLLQLVTDHVMVRIPKTKKNRNRDRKLQYSRCYRKVRRHSKGIYRCKGSAGRYIG